MNHPLMLRERRWLSDQGYARCRRDGKVIGEHRAIWEDTNGEIPKGMVLHHVNEDKLDNRIENLELITQADHMRIHKTTERWSPYGDTCSECGTSEASHKARGLCYRCYNRAHYHQSLTFGTKGDRYH